jgi:glycine/D-amino acid oxidase-like deaminating enzyme
MAKFPERAKVVIIGQGGIVGASMAHHLIERGWDDIVGIDKSGIPTDRLDRARVGLLLQHHARYLSIFTTQYSIDFYEKMGHYERIGGLEVARVGDDERMEEISASVASGKAFGNRVHYDHPGRDQGDVPAARGRHDPGRPVGSRMPAWSSRARRWLPAKLVDAAERPASCSRLPTPPAPVAAHRERPHQGRRHPRGTIMADHVMVCAGIWGPPDRRNGR